jgi:hypothetical protein
LSEFENIGFVDREPICLRIKDSRLRLHAAIGDIDIPKLIP